MIKNVLKIVTFKKKLFKNTYNNTEKEINWLFDLKIFYFHSSQKNYVQK